MKLLFSPAFTRAVKKVVKKDPDVLESLEQTLNPLKTDPYHPKLRTHKLKGKLAGSLACSAGYDLRIILVVVTEDGEEKILLQSIGTHDEVY